MRKQLPTIERGSQRSFLSDSQVWNGIRADAAAHLVALIKPYLTLIRVIAHGENGFRGHIDKVEICGVARVVTGKWRNGRCIRRAPVHEQQGHRKQEDRAATSENGGLIQWGHCGDDYTRCSKVDLS